MRTSILRAITVAYAVFALSPAVLADEGPAATVEQRQRLILEHIAGRTLKQGPIHTWVDAERWSIAHACLVMGVRLDEANQYLAEVAFASLSHGLVEDTDVQVTDLLRTYLEFRDSPGLSREARDHLARLFAGWEAPNRDRNRDADTAYRWPHEYTENHSLNILVAAYLIAHVQGDDAAPPRTLLQQFLADRAKWGWSEFNSTRYGMVTAKALVLLADHAPDESVRRAAAMHLDLVWLHYGTHCLSYWRGIPSSRGAENQGNNSRNALLPLARLWFGDPDPDARYTGQGFIAHFLTTAYRPPPAALALQAGPRERGRYAATQVVTAGPGKTRIPIVIWVTPVATMASAQGQGSTYDGAYAAVSFASSPDRVVTAGYGKGRNIFQYRNTMATFGSVTWHGPLAAEKDGAITIGGDEQVLVGQVDLDDECHLLMVGEVDDYGDRAAFRTALASLDASFTNGVVQWTVPDGTVVRMENTTRDRQWALSAATTNGEYARIDRNMLFDSPYLRSVRGSLVVEARHGGRKWTYDFRNPEEPAVTEEADTGFRALPAERVKGAAGVDLLYVPPGEFCMGSPLTEGRSNERPQRWVYVDGFYLSRTEVTVGQFRQYLEANAEAPRPPDWYWKEWGKGDDYAMTWVTWSEVQSFCRWLSAESGDRYRLPTEAEWEKAAKGYGHRAYPWGDSYDGTQSGSKNMTYLPVGSQPVDCSPFGAVDMAGNAWEWCLDWYDPRAYAAAATSNPRGPASGRLRSLRGCGWNFDPDTFRVGYRSAAEPNLQSVHIGFRVVRELPAATKGEDR